MKARLLLSIFLIGVSCCTALNVDQCPSQWFDAAWSLTVDGAVQLSTVGDPTYTHFKENLNYNDKQLELAIEDAFAFFNERFGLDFSQSVPNAAGIRFFQNSFLNPSRFPADLSAVITVNRWLLNGVLGSNRCFNWLEGGFSLRFIGNQTVHGTYGGEEGRTLNPTEEILYYTARVNVCPQNPLIIKCQSITPIFFDPEGYGVHHGECFSQFLGRGLVQGAGGVLTTDDPDVIRLIRRAVYTFPANP